MNGSKSPPQKARIPVAKLIWRFATGLHMDGRQRQNYRTRHVLPQYRDYFWNRYTRPQRALWRLNITWTLCLIGYGLIKERSITLYCLAASVPFIIAWLGNKAINHLTMRVSTTTSDGVKETYRTLRPRHYRRLERLKALRFRLRPPSDKAMPPDWERPIRAQMSEDGIAPVQQLRLPIQTLDIDELIKEQGPASGRGKTHQRNAKRSLP